MYCLGLIFPAIFTIPAQYLIRLETETVRYLSIINLFIIIFMYD